jgi:N12 class adenine-specific DNA methylase
MPNQFRIQDQHLVKFGSLRQRAIRNIKAIRLLKTIESEGRPATSAEQEILVQFVGWGALPQMFQYYSSWNQGDIAQTWRPLSEELEELLTSDEFNAAFSSTNNGHYTAKDVISSIWTALSSYGLIKSDTKVLEPSAGVGHFLGLMPDTLNPESAVAVELDSISARITKLLYPQSKVIHNGFENCQLVSNYFDLVVGNVPFGNYPIHDSTYPGHLTKSIHDYFLVKCIDLTAPGGVVAVITSRYSLDKVGGNVRQHLAKQATLLGAVRLPSGTFKENAGTEVVTDVLFFQKIPSTNANWLNLDYITIGADEYQINEYFVNHPQHVLGTITTEGTMYRSDEITVEGDFDRSRFESVAATFAKNLQSGCKVVASVPSSMFVHDNSKDGTFIYDEQGNLVQVFGTTFVPVRSKAQARIKALMSIRDLLRNLLSLDVNSIDSTDDLRAELHEDYCSFVGQFGPITSSVNRKAFGSDPDYLLLLSLEHYDPATDTATKADILTQRTINPNKHIDSVSDPKEALLVNLNETGTIDWSRIASLTGQSILSLQNELRGQVFRNPEGGTWETADQYLSGNVRNKLRVATNAFQLDKQFEINVEFLTSVQPNDLQPGEIEARLGATWIPTSYIASWLCGLISYGITVDHAPSIATWTVSCDGRVKHTVANRTVWGTPDCTALSLVEDALNGRIPTVYKTVTDKEGNERRVIDQDASLAAREKQQELKDHFQKWAWSDVDRAGKLAKIYNETFNAFRPRLFDGSHLTLPGMSRAHLRTQDLDPHQKNAIWRILQTKTTMLGHHVGAGKTFCIASAAIELKRMGLANKPMIVVPNHLVEQWALEFLKIYPQANLFIVGKDQFVKGKRETAMSKIASGNYDAIIISHRSFEFLPVSDEFYEAHIQKEIDAIEDIILSSNVGKSSRIVKKLEAAKKRLVARLKKQMNREAKDRTITFEELGVDQLFVDESDAFKNLGFATKMNRVAGLPNTESLRAFDMFLKIRYLMSSDRTRGVVFATGTPISNTIAEMYTLFRYLGLDLLTDLSMQHFDGWSANFAEAVAGLELAPDGSGYRVHTRFSRFVNVPELVMLFRHFADIQTSEMLKLPVPLLETGKPVVVSVPASNEQKAFIMSLVKRAERLKTEKVDPHDDNMLMITNDGRKAALDIRLVRHGSVPGTNTKVDAMASKVAEIWNATKVQRSTQMVFLDISTPSDSFNVYDDVRSKLLNLNVLPDEIAFIHDADTDEKKTNLFAAVNNGMVRILMGSTEKMGAGTNVQRKLLAMHHLDAPWRPRDIEQREGRIMRPGNSNPQVTIYRYVTQGSFDAYMWQTMETKARFISQVISGSTVARKIEDIENCTLTYAEVKAIASGNPKVIEKVRVDAEVRKYSSLKASHYNAEWTIRRQLVEIDQTIPRKLAHINVLENDIQLRNQHMNEEFSMMVGRQSFSERVKAGEALIKVLKSWEGAPCEEDVRGTIKGFRITSYVRFPGRTVLNLKGNRTYEVSLNMGSAGGTVQSIEYIMRSLENYRDSEKKLVETLERQRNELNVELTKPFDHQEKLKGLLIVQETLNRELCITADDQQAIALGQSEELAIAS